MKIFMMMKRLNFSGAPKMFAWLATALANGGHEVIVYTFMENEGVILPDKIRWIKKDLKGKGFFINTWMARHFIKETNPDVSISFLLDANVYNMFACLGLRTKSIVCERNDPYKPGYSILKFWKPWFRLANGAVFQLEKVREYYDNVRVPTAVIPNPIICRTDIDCPLFEQRKKAIVTLGRLDLFQKRQDILIDAFAKFVKEYPEYELHIYGKGEDEGHIKAQISRLGLDSSVKLMGVTNTSQMTIKDYQIYVLPSDFEGIPNALIEALAVGLPCIATDCRPGGSASLINDGVNGFLVPKGDADSICERMAYLVEHPREADRMGESAKSVRDTLEPKKIIGMWDKYLNEICKK